MKNKIKVHDGIVGTIILLSILAAVTINIAWLWLAGIIAVILISSAFTGFCPVYFVINKVMPSDD
jgi:hypothetical protein